MSFTASPQTSPPEFVGMISARYLSEIHPPQGPAVDVDYTRRFARVHEAAGFDRILIAHSSRSPDGFVIATDVLAHTDHVGVLLAHRPGFIQPTYAARMLATIDQFSGGRLALHVISGGNDTEQRRDGDFLDHDARYRRTDEYLEILRRVWTAERPFDHHGEHYRYEGAFSEVRCVQEPHIPIYFGGSSDIALEVAAKHADTYALWGEPLADAAAHIARVRELAAARGRSLRISISLRLILGETEEAAWARAHSIVDTIRANVSTGTFTRRPATNVGSQRLLAFADRADVHDKRLFTATAAASGAAGNSTSLVGTPEQVAESLLDDVGIGVNTLLVRGYDPLADAEAYGEVIRLVRDGAARQAVSVPA